MIMSAFGMPKGLAVGLQRGLSEQGRSGEFEGTKASKGSNGNAIFIYGRQGSFPLQGFQRAWNFSPEAWSARVLTATDSG